MQKIQYSFVKVQKRLIVDDMKSTMAADHWLTALKTQCHLSQWVREGWEEWQWSFSDAN